MGYVRNLKKHYICNMFNVYASDFLLHIVGGIIWFRVYCIIFVLIFLDGETICGLGSNDNCSCQKFIQCIQKYSSFSWVLENLQIWQQGVKLWNPLLQFYLLFDNIHLFFYKGPVYLFAIGEYIKSDNPKTLTWKIIDTTSCNN